jgi:hypothetical protein
MASLASDPIIDYDQLNKEDQQEVNQDRKIYLRAQRKLRNILTSGEWVSTHRDINIFTGDNVTSWEKTEGNYFKFFKTGATSITARNSYVLSDTNKTIYTVDWFGHINGFTNTFVLRDPNMPNREAYGRYFPKTDTIQLLINGPAGQNAEPFATTSWGITTNHYSNIN